MKKFARFQHSRDTTTANFLTGSDILILINPQQLWREEIIRFWAIFRRQGCAPASSTQPGLERPISCSVSCHESNRFLTQNIRVPGTIRSSLCHGTFWRYRSPHHHSISSISRNIFSSLFLYDLLVLHPLLSCPLSHLFLYLWPAMVLTILERFLDL